MAEAVGRPLIRRVPRGWVLAALLLPLLAVLAAVVPLARGFKPADRVDVTVHNNPPTAKFICLLAEGPAGAEALPYVKYYTYDIPHREHPTLYGPWTRNHYVRNNGGIGSPVPVPVSWREADRYGVLIWNGGDDWRLWWFDRGAVPVAGRSRLLGGGAVTLTLPPGDPGTPAPADVLDEVGFGPNVRQSWKDFPDSFPPR